MLDLGTMVALGGYGGSSMPGAAANAKVGTFNLGGALGGASQFAGSSMNTAGGGSPSTGNFKWNNYNSLSPFFTGSQGGGAYYGLQGSSNPGRTGLGTFYSRSTGPI